MTARLSPGESGSSGSIAIEFAELAALAAQLRSLQTEMEHPHGTLAAQLDDDVAGAFSKAEADWTGERRKLAAFFHTMADGVDASVQAYREADAAVQAAAAPHRAGGR